MVKKKHSGNNQDDPNAQPIGPYDLMLAAQALRLGAVLVTHNTAEFARVQSLSLEDWQS